MNQKLILENWRKFLKEEVDELTKVKQETAEEVESDTAVRPEPTEQEKTEAAEETIINSVEHSLTNAVATAKKNGISPISLKNDLINSLNNLVREAKKKKSGDRCTRIAKRKYDVWPSAYASGAVVKCRQGKIWKGVSENASNQEIDDALLLEEIEIIEEAKKKDYKPNFSKEKEQGLHGWFARNKGKGWVNCRTGGPCGRDNADSGGKYPACRPTKAQCKSAGKGPLRKKKSSSPISWTKKKKKD
jgi:hypothetical protein